MMTEDPILLAAEPQLFVPDLPASCAFWVDRLGFELAFVHGDPPFYAQVRRGGARLNLRLATGDVFASGFREREADALSATVVVHGIKALFDAFDAAGVAWQRRLRDEPWRARPFILRDPGGNLIAFAE